MTVHTHTLTHTTCPDLVEEFEEFGAGLVDGADDGSAPLGQSLEQRDHLETRRAVKTTETHTAGLMGINRHPEPSRSASEEWTKEKDQPTR